MPSPPTPKAERTRHEILTTAVDLASVEGLGGLSIGRLASATNLSKSGLFAHFGSKEDLQLAVVDTARDMFAAEVLGAGEGLSPGLERLLGLSSAWIEHVARGAFRGGCFFAAASTEVDDRPGRVRDLVIELTGRWMKALEADAAAAIQRGELDAECDPAQLAFELHAFVQEANWAFQLHGRSDAFDLARRATLRVLRQAATSSGRPLLAPMEQRA